MEGLNGFRGSGFCAFEGGTGHGGGGGVGLPSEGRVSELMRASSR